MKKILTVLTTLLIILSLVGCSNNPTPQPKEEPTRDVQSANEFKTLGFVIDIPTLSGVTNAKYKIEDNDTARVYFDYLNHSYQYAASKTKTSNQLMNFFASVPYEAKTFNVEGNDYSIANYAEGSVGAWTSGGVNYALYGEGLGSDDLHGFGMVIAECAGIEIPEEEEVTVEIPSNVLSMNKQEIEKFLRENNFQDIDFEYASSKDVKKDYVISISQTGTVHPYDEIVVVISTGPSATDTMFVPDNLCGKSEAEFVDIISDLSLVPVKLGTKYYSTTIVRGSVYKYDDGKFPVGTEIKYNLSAGPYQFAAEDYNGKTVEQVNALVASLNNINAHVNFAYKEVETNNHTHGLTYDCSASKDGVKTNVACNLAKPVQDTKVDLPNFVGTYYNPCGNKSTCSLNGINYEIFKVCDGYPAGYVSAQTVKPGKVEKGTYVGLTISTEMPYIHNVFESFYHKYECDLSDETEEALKNDPDLMQLDHVVFERDMSGQYRGGEVVNVLIWDDRGYWVSEFEPGRYPKDTVVRIVIAENLLY